MRERSRVGFFVMALAASGFLRTSIALADTAYDVDLPAQPLADALRALGKQVATNILIDRRLVTDQKAPALRAHLTADEAIAKLLAGTGLTMKHIDEHTVTVVAAGTERAPADPPSAAAVQESSDKIPLEEIVVTAQKRAERLIDVPVPVSAISGQALIDNNQLRLQDYFSSIPGFMVTPTIGLGSQQLLSIRGITSGGGNPSVGVTVDDAPYGSSTLLGGGEVVPDIDPGDIDHIEVLRGPQGTLYGASSMGGLLKFVTVDPSTDSLSGRLQMGTGTIKNGDGPAYNARGSLNVPLGDTAAIRASAFSREDPGYIDNPILNVDGINKTTVYGGHLSGLWKPSDDLSLKLSALYQNTAGHGSNEVNLPTEGVSQTAGLGELQQSYVSGIGENTRKVQSYSATVNAKLGAVALTSITAYNINSFTDSFDYTYLLGDCCTQPKFGVTGTPLNYANTTRKFTQEIRFSAAAGERFDWLLGGFYTHERSAYDETLDATDALSGRFAGQWLYEAIPSTYSEYAGFADLTYHFTSNFDVQVGGRESHIRQAFGQVQSGPYLTDLLGVASPLINPTASTTADVFTYLLTPELKIRPDLMVYARLASGYRAGGPNSTPGTPRQFAADKTKNYEIGLKGDVLGHALTFDASVYLIDWKDIQLTFYDASTGGYQGNAGGARSKGIELSVQVRPVDNLVINGWVTFSDAVLTDSLPFGPGTNGTTYGVAGDRLPYSSRFSGNLSLEKSFPIASQATAFVGAAVSYIGDRTGVFTGSAIRQDLPAYAKTDARVGVRWDRWDAHAFVTNAFDRRGLLAGGIGNFPPFGFLYVQPRTIGLAVSRAF